MWTFQRYRNWLDNRKTWHVPNDSELPDTEPSEPSAETAALPPMAALPKAAKPSDVAPPSTSKTGGRIEIEPIEGGFEKILKKLE
jgi:hypothetical protein